MFEGPNQFSFDKITPSPASSVTSPEEPKKKLSLNIRSKAYENKFPSTSI